MNEPEQTVPVSKPKRPVVRRLSDALLPGCAEVEKACFHAPWSVESLKLLTGSMGTGYAVLDGAGNVAAYGGMLYAADEGQITNIGVLPAFRRLGFGRAVTDALLSDAFDAGMESVTLEVRESNSPARAMYTAFGFTEVGRRPHFYDKPDETAILLTVTKKQYETARRKSRPAKTR